MHRFKCLLPTLVTVGTLIIMQPTHAFVQLAKPNPTQRQETPSSISPSLKDTTIVAQADAPTSPATAPEPKNSVTLLPRLVNTSTTSRDSQSLGATYFFTIEIPDSTAQPLEKVEFVLTQGVQYPRFQTTSVKAFEGTKRQQGTPLPIDSVVSDRSIRTLTVTFDQPVAPGRTITLAIRPIRNPSRGTYLFEVRGTSAGATDSQYLGLGRLEFFRSSFGS